MIVNFDIVLIVLFVVLALLFIPIAFWFRRIFSMLEKKHVQTWNDLGSPTLLLNNSVKNNLLMLSFLQRRKFKELNDQDLNKDCERLIFFITVYLGLFLAFFITITMVIVT